MQIVREFGNEEIAKVYVSKIRGNYVEFAESLQPPLKLKDKWVIIVSCLFGCPVKCLMCDAGQYYDGLLNKEEIFDQIDHVITQKFPNRKVPVKKFKIQFTRMGEPALNPAILDVLEELPKRYDAPGLLPSVSTIGPKNSEDFFNRLRDIKNNSYRKGKFQFQFSIHTTDSEKRDQLIPIPKMNFREIAEYGKKFYASGDRKITLNFVVMEDYPIDPEVIHSFFDPAIFIIKLTPLNPTGNAENNQLQTKLDPHNEKSVTQLVDKFHSFGFDTIVSIGELEENEIGSNCGQYITAHNALVFDKSIKAPTIKSVIPSSESVVR